MPRSGSPLVSPIEGTHRRRAAAVEHQSVGSGQRQPHH